MSASLPCIVCRKTLENVGHYNQPLDGLEFTTGGHYGTTVFDPMDGSLLAINVCDECLRKAIAEDCTLEYTPTLTTRSVRRATKGTENLTGAQTALLEFVGKQLQTTGIPPSYNEIADALGLRSRSGVHRLISELETLGYVTRLPHRPRSLELLKVASRVAA